MTRALGLSLLISLLGTTAARAQTGEPAAELAFLLPIDLRAEHLQRGVLSGPSSAPPEAIARSIAAPLGEHRVTSVRHLSTGVLVQLLRTHRGLDVIGSDLSVRIDRAGQVRWVSAHPTEVPPALSVEAGISAREALSAAAGHAIADALAPARHTRLVIFGPSARLAFETRFQVDELRQTYRVYIDARTAEVLWAESLVRHAPEHLANVYDVSPVDGPLGEVTFEALPPGSTTLTDEDFAVVGCVDRGRCHEVLTSTGPRRVHHCDMEPTAFAGADGSFLAYEPPSDHADPTDPFSEVQAYQHLRSGIAAFRAFADDDSFALRNAVTVVVNHRVPVLFDETALCEPGQEDAPAGSTLQVEENAYFWPAGGLGPTELGDRIVLHQGHRADWAYDGEVVWHELTHAVMNSLTELAWRRADERGTSYEGGGLHEGFSDYFAATMSGRSALGYYAGTDESGPQALGDLEEAPDCRDVMTGEEHDEGAPWSGALWAIRRLLRSQAKRDMFDRSLFVVLDALSQLDGFERASELVLAELELGAEAFVVDYALSAADAAFLHEQVASAEARFSERGLPSCNGRVQPLTLGQQKDSLQLVGPIVWGITEHRGRAIPASVQLEVQLTEAAPGLRLSVTESEATDDTLRGPGFPDAPELTVLIRRGAPLTWRWDGAAGTHDAEHETALRVFPGSDGLAEIRGDFAPGTYYLQVANAGAGVVLYGISVEAVTGDDAADRAGGSDFGASCSATPAGSGPGAVGLGWLLAALVWRLRRRA